MNATQTDATLERIAAMDPERETALDAQRRALAAASLHRILHDPSPARQPMGNFNRASRRLAMRRAGAVGLAGVLTLAGATAATGVTLTGVITGVGALTATAPPMLTYPGTDQSASALLTGIARAASGQPVSSASGEYRHVHWQAWSMRGGENEPDRIVPVERWIWLADDGTARTLHVEEGASGRYKDWPVGGMGEPLADRVTLTSDADGTARALTGAASAAQADAYQLIDRYTQLAQSQGMGAEPNERVGFLRALAATDVVAHGPVTDRAGREGQAFGASWEHDGLRDELRIVVDPTTGQLLAQEHILHGPWILGSASTVVNYVVFLENTRTTSLPDCGDLGCRTMPAPG